MVTNLHTQLSGRVGDRGREVNIGVLLKTLTVVSQPQPRFPFVLIRPPVLPLAECLQRFHLGIKCNENTSSRKKEGKTQVMIKGRGVDLGETRDWRLGSFRTTSYLNEPERRESMVTDSDTNK